MFRRVLSWLNTDATGTDLMTDAVITVRRRAIFPVRITDSVAGLREDANGQGAAGFAGTSASAVKTVLKNI